MTVRSNFSKTPIARALQKDSKGARSTKELVKKYFGDKLDIAEILSKVPSKPLLTPISRTDFETNHMPIYVDGLIKPTSNQ
jgi:hypothetical protein